MTYSCSSDVARVLATLKVRKSIITYTHSQYCMFTFCISHSHNIKHTSIISITPFSNSYAYSYVHTNTTDVYGCTFSFKTPNLHHSILRFPCLHSSAITFQHIIVLWHHTISMFIVQHSENCKSAYFISSCPHTFIPIPQTHNYILIVSHSGNCMSTYPHSHSPKLTVRVSYSAMMRGRLSFLL